MLASNTVRIFAGSGLQYYKFILVSVSTQQVLQPKANWVGSRAAVNSTISHSDFPFYPAWPTSSRVQPTESGNLGSIACPSMACTNRTWRMVAGRMDQQGVNNTGDLTWFSGNMIWPYTKAYFGGFMLGGNVEDLVCLRDACGGRLKLAYCLLPRCGSDLKEKGCALKYMLFTKTWFANLKLLTDKHETTTHIG